MVKVKTIFKDGSQLEYNDQASIGYFPVQVEIDLERLFEGEILHLEISREKIQRKQH